ncbi:MAG: DUF6531 domain-containing protein [Nannocystaceae bacterium]
MEIDIDGHLSEGLRLQTQAFRVTAVASAIISREPKTSSEYGEIVTKAIEESPFVKTFTEDTYAGHASAAVKAAKSPIDALKEIATTSIDGLFSLAVADLSAMFEAPIAPLLITPHVGIPHAHAHPPAVVLPSLGLLLFGGCASVLCASVFPAGRVGDFGLAATCCGFSPYFQVTTGSSKVFIGGKRAARALDITRHCLPPAAEATASAPPSWPDILLKGPLKALKGPLARWRGVNKQVQALAFSGVDVALSELAVIEKHSALRDDASTRRTEMMKLRTDYSAAIQRGDLAAAQELEYALRQDLALQVSTEESIEGTAVQALTVAGQAILDAVTEGIKSAAGKDPGAPAAIGALFPGLPVITVGGFPVPPLDALVDGLAKAVTNSVQFGKLYVRNPLARTELLQLARGTFSRPRLREALGSAGRFLTGDPVDAVSGAVISEGTDATLRGGWPLDFARRYSSAWSERDSALGFGWSASVDQALWLERAQVVVRIEDGREIVFEHDDGVDPRTVRRTLVEPVEALRLRPLGGDRWELVDGEGVVREFAAIAGEREPLRGIARMVRMARMVGPEGATLSFHYDASARLSSVQGPGGRTLGLRWDERDHLVALTLPRPEGPGDEVVVRYDYSIDGDLIAITDACGGRRDLVYDDHRLVEEREPDGQRFYFTYDGPGSEARCVRAWGEGDVFARELVYNTERRMTVVTHGAGEVLVIHADGWGRLLQIDDARGGSRRFEYDAIGRRTAEIDPAGNVRRFEYDALGRLIRSIDETGAARALEYDAAGRAVAAVDPLGGRTRRVFGDDGRLAAVIDAQGATTTLEPAGAATIVTDPEGHALKIERDEHGQPRRRESAEGGRWRFVHDRRGRLIEVVDPLGRRERRRYDACDRLIASDGAAGPRTIARDASGRATAIASDDETIERVYHPSRTLAARADARGRIAHRRDGDGALVELTRADGATHTFTRDPRGSVVGEATFDGRTLRYQRDLADRITSVSRGSGERTTYAHDAAGRVTEIRYADGARERFSYREDGLMIAAIREEGERVDAVTIERDRLGRVTREVQGERWIASELDRNGRRRRLISALGLGVTIERDPAGRARSVVAELDRRRWQVQIRRDAAGVEVERALPGEVTASWQRDELGRPTVRTVIAPLGAPSSWDQSLGRPRGPICERVHAWEGARRLRAVTEDGATLLDRDGLAGDPGANSPAVTHVRDADGRVIERVHADGRIDRLGWDAADRLREVLTAEGVRVRYDYDALGRRIRRHVGDEVTTWLWDGDHPLHEIIAHGEKDMSFKTWLFDPEAWSPLGVILGEPALAGSSRMIGVVSDLVGAPMLAVDDQGAVVWRGAPTADGAAIAPRAGASIALALQFPGQFADPQTGLHDNHHRVYDPAAGSYLSPDPLGLAGGVRPHAYVDDPWTMIDPLGKVQSSAVDGDAAAPGSTTYQAPLPPAAAALIDGDERDPRVDISMRFGAHAVLTTGLVVGAIWRAKRCAK